MGRSPISLTPSASAMVGTTSDGSAMEASGTKNTPSTK